MLCLVPLVIGWAAADAHAQIDVRDEIFYQIMPIAWRDADGDTYRFGDFGGMTASLGYLGDLGVTAIWLNPIFPSPAYHGYQHGRADELNAWFGTDSDFVAFVEAAHAAGIKVFVDLVCYGISHDSPWFADAYGNPASPYDTWLAFENPANTEYLGSVYTTWNGSTVGFIHWDLRDSNPVSLVTGWAEKWLDPDGNGDFTDGIDGYRLDHVWRTYPYGPDGWGYHLDTFWAPWRDALRAVNPDVFVFAEQADWGSHGSELLSGLDAAFTKPFEFAARHALQIEESGPLYGEMATTLATLNGVTEGTYLCTIGNHDVDRLATSIGDDFEKGKAAAAVLLTQPLPPVIYHGDEIGMRGAKDGSLGSDASDIPMREPFKWNAVAGPPMSNYYAANPGAYAASVSHDHDGRSVEEQLGVPGSLLEAYRQLIGIRADNVALRRGAYLPVTTTSMRAWAFVRDHPDQQVLVAVNVSGSPASFTADLSAYGIPGGSTTPIDLVSGASLPPLTDANKSAYAISLAPYQVLILDVDLAAPEPPVSLVDGRDIPDEFGAGAHVATQDTPTSLGDNLSELDELYVRREGEVVFVGATGNLALDGTGFALLVDAMAGGQNVLDMTGASPPPSGPEALTGMRLDAGFEPERMLFVNAFGGNVYVDEYRLLTGGGTTKTYRGVGLVNAGNGFLSGGVNPNGLEVALDDTNVDGVTDTDASGAATATTGFELAIPVEDLELPPDAETMGVAAFLLLTSGEVSNQWLPGVGGIMGLLGVAPDMTAIAGDQFGIATLDDLAATPPGAAGGSRLTVSARMTRGPLARIRIASPRAGSVRVTITDVAGREVAELRRDVAGPGDVVFTWAGDDVHGRSVGAGVYLVRAQLGRDAATTRIVWIP